MRFGWEPKLTAQQIKHAQKLIEQAIRQYEADLLNVGHVTLYRALAAA